MEPPGEMAAAPSISARPTSDRGTAGPGGSRVLVVGASSGIGRELARRSGEAGSAVVLVARRLELVEGVAASIRDGGGRARAWRCDVTDEAECAAVVAEAAAWLGGIDTVYYMAGSSPLVRIADADARVWNDLLSVNLVGAAVVVRACLDSLRRSSRPVVVVTTHSMGTPWPWLGAYATTKAGLAELARALRVEEPGIRFVCVSVGSTTTSFADAWDPQVAGTAMDAWAEGGLFRYSVLQAGEMADAMLATVADDAGPDDLLIAGDPLTGTEPT